MKRSMDRFDHVRRQGRLLAALGRITDASDVKVARQLALDALNWFYLAPEGREWDPSMGTLKRLD